MPTAYKDRAEAIQQQARRDWYRIENKAGTGLAKVYLYDEIGFFGVSAQQFADEVLALDVKQIDLHVNSPGGEVWDGIAILNTLRDHPARVVTYVDGVAASSASFIAMAGDEVVMARNSELMIHDAWGMAVGNAGDLADLAERLSKMSDNIASIYAERTDKPVTYWRDAMRAETWFSAEEAVEAGLADRVVEKVDATEAKNRFDLSIFNYAGRAKAPDPVYPAEAGVQEEHMGTQPDVVSVNVPATTEPPSTPEPNAAPVETDVSKETTPAAPATGGSNNQEGVGMELDPAKLREAFGLRHPEASDEDVRSTVVASGYASLTPFDEGGPAPAKVGKVAKASDSKPGPGVVMVDQSILDQLRQDAAAGQEAFARLVRQERDATIAAAINDGKFAPARREHWEKAWDRDPEGTKDAIKNLSKGLIPVSPAGYSVDPDGHSAEDELYKELYGAGEVFLMADYTPVHNPGHEISLTASATVVGGQALAISGSGTVAPSGADTVAFIGVAAHDAASGARVTVFIGPGLVHETTATGAIVAGALVATDAAGGTVKTNGAGVAPIGVAITTASGGVVRWKATK